MEPARTYSNGALSIHTVDEAAGILRVKRSWLERQAAARKIPFTMLGGSYRFTIDHLIQIVRMHENAPSAEPVRNLPAAPRTVRAVPPAGALSATPLRARPRPGPRRAA